MENYIKLGLIGKGGGGNTVQLVKDLSEGRVRKRNNYSLFRDTQ